MKKKTYFLSLVFIISIISGISGYGAAKKPVLNIDFSNKSGNIIKNSVNNTKVGILKGQYKKVEGKKGKAIEFGLDSYGIITNPEVINNTLKKGQLTFETWLFKKSDEEHGFIFRQEGAISLLVIPWDPARLNLAIWDKGGKYIGLDTGRCLKAGVWQHIAVTINRKLMRLYVDGKLIGKKKLEQGLKPSSEKFYIAAGFCPPNNKYLGNLCGIIDEMKLYDYVKDDNYFAKLKATMTENFDTRIEKIECPPKVSTCKEISNPEDVFISTKNRNNIVIENSYYKLTIDAKDHLTLKSLINKYISSECLNKSGSALFHIAVDGKSIPKNNFRVTRISNKKEVNNKSITFWLYSQKDKVTAKFIIKSGKNQDIDINLKIVNKSNSNRKFQVTAPLLENVSIGNNFKENYYFWPWLSGWAGKKSFELGAAYDSRCWIQLMDIFSPAQGGGVALWSKDSKGEIKGALLRKTLASGRIGIRYNMLFLPKEAAVSPFAKWAGTGMAFVYLPSQLKPQEAYSYPTGTISIHKGSCLVPLKKYGKWTHKSWFKHNSNHKKLKYDFNFVAVNRTCGNRGFQKGFLKKNSIRPELFINPDQRDHHIQFAGWWKDTDKKNSGWGDYDYNPAWGGKEGLQKAIQRCRAKGTEVSLYLCTRAGGKKTRIAKAKGAEWGYYISPNKQCDDWGSQNFCTQVPEWQKYIAGVYARVVKDFKLDGVYLDTSAEVLFCQSPVHSHSKNLADDQVRLLKTIRAAINKYNPQAYIWCEFLGSDFFAQYIDATWVQTFAHPHAHAFNNYDLDFTRFIYPEIKHVEWGMGEKSFGVDSKRAFFNGVGVCRGDLTDKQNDWLSILTQAQRENGDALASLKPEPFVKSLKENVYINYFPTNSKKLWTIYNKNKSAVDAEVLEVEQSEGYRYIETLYDTEVKIIPNGNSSKLHAKIPALNVACIVKFKRKMELKDESGILSVMVKDAPNSAKLLWTTEVDENRDLVSVPLVNGKAILGKTKDINGKIIVKLMDEKELIDEIVNNDFMVKGK